MGYMVREKMEVEVNDDILNFLGIDNNVNLSDISNSDKVYMIYLLKQYYLSLRNRLGFDKNITIGLEIEFENAFRDIIDSEMFDRYSLDKWCVVDDGSLNDGGEINSPKLIDSEKTWIDLSGVCDIVNKNAYVGDNTSAHIHIGTQILGNNPKYWANFAKLWATYENVIFRFLYGEYVSPRMEITKYAAPISSDLIKNMERINDRAKRVSAIHMFKVFDAGEEVKKFRRRKSVNFTNISDLESYIYNMEANMNTVEFRSANGTFDPVIWQNNVNLIVRLMLYCKSEKFDEDKIIKRMNQIVEDNIASNIYKYSRIYMEQAIELADMIFDNNLEKVYFLRQYVKDGNVSNRPLVKSREFTRR